MPGNMLKWQSENHLQQNTLPLPGVWADTDKAATTTSLSVARTITMHFITFNIPALTPPSPLLLFHGLLPPLNFILDGLSLQQQWKQPWTHREDMKQMCMSNKGKFLCQDSITWVMTGDMEVNIQAFLTMALYNSVWSASIHNKVGGSQRQCSRGKHKTKSPCHELNTRHLAHNQMLNHTRP